MRVLISGAGIAGPTLAWWLRRYGMTPVIVESAPRLRTGGYIIDFWGAGYDVADRMHLLPAIESAGYVAKEVRIVDGRGRRVGGFPADVFREIAGGRYVSLGRGDLAALLYGALENEVETIFGDSIASLDDRGSQVRVTFEKGAPREFDAVVGADGLHSRVREIAFGPEAAFEKYLGYYVAAFEVKGYRPRDELVYVMYTDVGRQVGRFAMRGDTTMVLFMFAEREVLETSGLAAQKDILRDRFRQSQWETPRILNELDPAPALYFDRVSQIRMDQWSSGRIALVGDAAYCVSLLAGQGTALAMAGAFVLARELSRCQKDPAEAFCNYHRFLAGFLAEKQKAALGFASSLVPASRAQLFVRNQLSRLLSIRPIAALAAGKGFLDRITLPEE